MGLSISFVVACLVAAQVSPTATSLTTRLDAVVRSMMPEWVLDPMGPLHPPDPRREEFRWRKHPAELGGDLFVRVQTYDTPEAAEEQLRKTILGISSGSREIQGVGDHAYLATMNPSVVWSGSVYARVGTRLLSVSGAKDGADIKALAAAFVAELRQLQN